jgi:hypothetical protein
MSRYTIIPEDLFVSVDGESRTVPSLQLDPRIHAVQWYGTYGEVEFKSVFNEDVKLIEKPQNRIFIDPAEFQAALDAWSITPPMDINL